METLRVVPKATDQELFLALMGKQTDLESVLDIMGCFRTWTDFYNFVHNPEFNDKLYSAAVFLFRSVDKSDFDLYPTIGIIEYDEGVLANLSKFNVLELRTKLMDVRRVNLPYTPFSIVTKHSSVLKVNGKAQLPAFAVSHYERDTSKDIAEFYAVNSRLSQYGMIPDKTIHDETLKVASYFIGTHNEFSLEKGIIQIEPRVEIYDPFNVGVEQIQEDWKIFGPFCSTIVQRLRGLSINPHSFESPLSSIYYSLSMNWHVIKSMCFDRLDFGLAYRCFSPGYLPSFSSKYNDLINSQCVLPIFGEFYYTGNRYCRDLFESVLNLTIGPPNPDGDVLVSLYGRKFSNFVHVVEENERLVAHFKHVEVRLQKTLFLEFPDRKYAMHYFFSRVPCHKELESWTFSSSVIARYLGLEAPFAVLLPFYRETCEMVNSVIEYATLFKLSSFVYSMEDPCFIYLIITNSHSSFRRSRPIVLQDYPFNETQFFSTFGNSHIPIQNELRKTINRDDHLGPASEGKRVFTGQIQCQHCGKKFGKLSSMNDHIRNRHPRPIPLKAPPSRKDSFLSNMEGMFSCPICMATFSSGLLVRRHIKKSHPSAIVP